MTIQHVVKLCDGNASLSRLLHVSGYCVFSNIMLIVFMFTRMQCLCYI